MVKVIKRISRILALFCVYLMCAYGYLNAKGFILIDGKPVLSNQAEAKEENFSKKVSGEMGMNAEMVRVKGDKDAPLTMYAYSSMMCSHCRDFHNYIYPKLERDFVSAGKLKFVFVHFPLDVVSMRAAKLSYCLPKEKYYDFITELYANKDWQFSDKEETLNAYAEKMGMAKEEIKACEENKKLTSDILMMRDTAVKSFGVQGTPSFIVEDKTGKELIIGSRPYDELKKYLNKRLEGKE